MIVAKKNELTTFSEPSAAICLRGVLDYRFSLKVKSTQGVEKIVTLGFEFSGGVWYFWFTENETEDLSNGVIKLTDKEQYEFTLILTADSIEKIIRFDTLQMI